MFLRYSMFTRSSTAEIEANSNGLWTRVDQRCLFNVLLEISEKKSKLNE